MESHEEGAKKNVVIHITPVNSPNGNYNSAIETKISEEPKTTKNNDGGKCFQNDVHSEVEQQTEKISSVLHSLLESAKKERLHQKITHVLAVGTVILLAHSVLSVQWLLPYYYTISTPFLLLLRTIMYWKYKWQFFLIDFCYYGNILCFIFIWAAPHIEELFIITFAITNGPMLWAMAMFRNSLVFHSIDKVTSVYIHLLPALLLFVIRWYGDRASTYWYCRFLQVDSQLQLSFVILWMIVVPLCCFILHSLLYGLVVFLAQPPEDYLTSFRYLTNRKSSIAYRAVTVFGPKWMVVMYNVYGWVFCLMSVSVTVLLYHFFIAHVAFIIFMVLLVTYNGASFYLDVFGPRSMDECT